MKVFLTRCTEVPIRGLLVRDESSEKQVSLDRAGRGLDVGSMQLVARTAIIPEESEGLSGLFGFGPDSGVGLAAVVVGGGGVGFGVGALVTLSVRSSSSSSSRCSSKGLFDGGGGVLAHYRRLGQDGALQQTSQIACVPSSREALGKIRRAGTTPRSVDNQTRGCLWV